MKKILLFSVFIMLSSQLFSIDLHTGDEYGTVVVYRPDGLVGMALSTELMVNQSVLIEFKRKQAVELKLNPGIYLFHVQPTGIWDVRDPLYAVIKVEVKAEDIRYFKVVPAMYKAYKYEETGLLEDRDNFEFVDSLKWIKEDE